METQRETKTTLERGCVAPDAAISDKLLGCSGVLLQIQRPVHAVLRHYVDT